MTLRSIVWKELRERPASVATGIVAILLGVAALVAIRHITVFSEREVGRQLASLGANILILPDGASLQDYYSADRNGQTLPEEYAAQIMLAGLAGVERLSPRLCVPVEFGGQTTPLTGILPQAEFEAQSAWQTVGLFQRKAHVGCKKACAAPDPADALPSALTSKRTIAQLQDHELVLGADVAQATRLSPGDSVPLWDEAFCVLAVLPPTGTYDDSRVFAHLHTVQRLAGAGEVVNAIEVFGCCEDAAGQLVPQLRELLPHTKVVTISQVVQAQVGVNRLMSRTSLLVLVVLVLVGGVSVASSIAANVRERRREIGTMMALGASRGFVCRLFLLKAVWLGLAGGIGGCLLGTGLAMILGPQWGGVRVSPLASLLVAAMVVTLMVTLVAAYLPARRAANLDPCICFQEA